MSLEIHKHIYEYKVIWNKLHLLNQPRWVDNIHVNSLWAFYNSESQNWHCFNNKILSGSCQTHSPEVILKHPHLVTNIVPNFKECQLFTQLSLGDSVLLRFCAPPQIDSRAWVNCDNANCYKMLLQGKTHHFSVTAGLLPCFW